LLEGDLKRCGAAAHVFVRKAEADLRAEAAATGALSIVAGKDKQRFVAKQHKK